MSDQTAPEAAGEIDVYTALEEIRDVAVFTGSRPTTWEFVSPAFEDFYGISEETVRDDATRILENVHPEDRGHVAAIFDELAADPSEKQFDHRIDGTEREERWVRVHLAPVQYGEGQTGVVGIISDISEQKYREQELVVLHRLLQHDIRNDMAVITGWLDILAEQTEGTQEIIDRVRTASQQVLNLTEDTRDIVRATSGDESTELEPTRVKPILETILEERRELDPDAEFRVGGTIPDIAVSANSLLSTVIRNLVSNAVKHNDKPTPRVTISVRERAATAVIEITDNGPGIPEDQEEKLFQMGEKGVDSSGTGLGLYLCRQIIESFDGKIWYEPAESGGATFCIEVPLAD